MHRLGARTIPEPRAAAVVTGPSRHSEDRRRLLGHDAAGEAYPAGSTPSLGDGPATRPSEPVASRSTEAEARDLVALRRAKRGDTSAFAQLLQTNDTGVRALLVALVGPDRADALAATVYLRAYRGLPLAPATSPRIWLLGIADGTVRDSIRRWKRRSADPGDSPDPLDPPIPLDMAPEQRLVLAAVDGVGLTPREAARLVGGGVDHTRELLAAARSEAAESLPLPEPADHDPGFWDDLGRRLLIEQSGPSASTPRAPGAPPRRDVAAAQSFPLPMSADAARGMAVRVEQQNPRSFPWRSVGLAGAIIATIAVIIGGAVQVAQRASQRDAGLGDTATKVLNQLDAALARDTVVRGTVTVRAAGTDALSSSTLQLVRSNAGSWRNTALDGSYDEGYDLTDATLSIVRRGSDDQVEAVVHAGLAPGPPAETAVTDDMIGDLLADSIRVVRSGSNGSVTSRSTPTTTDPETAETSAGGTTTTVVERPVWVVTSRLDESASPAILAGSGALSQVRADEVELIADRSLALPIQLTLRREGSTVASVSFTDLSISQQQARTTYAPDAPSTARVTRTDGGFESTTLGALADAGAGTVPTPSYLPGGYVFTGAAVNAAQGTTVVCYRNGSRQLVLTGRPNPSDPAADPLSSDGAVADPKSVTLDSGAFTGQQAHTSIDPIGHVWVGDRQTQIVAIGDPPVSQLTKVVASLR